MTHIPATALLALNQLSDQAGEAIAARVFGGRGALVNPGRDYALSVVTTALRIMEGTNARMGTATLVVGTVVVNTTSVTANSRIFLTAQNTGGTPGALRVSARVAGTSFTITSTSATDTSAVAWVIIEPGP